MSYRYMRVIVMFDLPIETEKQRKSYRDFRKYLIKNGFLMLQKSIYCKLAQNSAASDALTMQVKKNKPQEGLVQILRVTEKQYSKMEYVVGVSEKEVLDSDERLVVL